jgi:hypothetical protein
MAQDYSAIPDLSGFDQESFQTGVSVGKSFVKSK